MGYTRQYVILWIETEIDQNEDEQNGQSAAKEFTVMKYA